MTWMCSLRRAVACGAALAWTVAPRAALSQDSLTLAQAVAMAQHQGLPAAAAEATREATRQRSRAFGDRLLPQLSLSGTVPSYTHAINSVPQNDGTTQFRTVQRSQSDLGLTLTQPLPFSGGALSVRSALDQVQDPGAPTPLLYSTAPVTFALTQGLFQPNETKWNMREQGLQLDVAERQYVEAREDIALNTSGAFFDLYGARVALDNAVTNAAVNDTLYTLNKGRFDVGKIGENDLLQSELALLRSRNALDGAKLDFQRLLAAFRLAINVAPGAPVGIKVTTDVPSFDADTDLAVAQALKNRSAASGYELQAVDAQRRISEAKLNNGFGATVQASYGFNASGPSVNTAYANPLTAQGFSLSVQMPLLQWGARSADIQAAQADEHRVDAQARASREQAAQDAQFAALGLAQARRSLVLSAKADTVAAKRFEVAYNRYVIGRITIDNLYIAQSEKDAALQAEVQALRAYWTAYYRLRRVTLYDFEAGRPLR